jgi:hypothetical protein
MPTSDAAPPKPPLRSRATLHAEAANACLADRGIIDIIIAHLIAARDANAPAAQLQDMLEEAKNTMRHSIDRFEGVNNLFASMKLLALLYALDPSVETLTFVLERLRATQQWDMARTVETMLAEQTAQNA